MYVGFLSRRILNHFYFSSECNEPVLEILLFVGQNRINSEMQLLSRTQQKRSIL